MSAKCFLVTSGLRIYAGGNGFGPLHALQAASGKLDYGVRDFGSKNPLAVKKKTVNTRNGFGITKSLTDLGDIDLTGSGGNLCVVGSRNSILEMFQQADQSIQITVGLPPGVFIGVYRQENLLKSDTITIEVRSGTRASHAPDYAQSWFDTGTKRGNAYTEYHKGKKSWKWNWFNVTADLSVSTNGTTTLHPKAFTLALKNIFDNNKWW